MGGRDNIGGKRIVGEPEPDKGRRRRRPRSDLASKELMEKYRVAPSHGIGKSRELPEVPARELVAGALFVGQDGKMWRVTEIDDESVKAVALVSGAKKKTLKKKATKASREPVQPVS